MAHLGGVSEVVELVGISRQRFSELRARADFPEPVAELASGPIWDLSEIERWASSGVRRGPGRPAKVERVLGDRFVLDGDPLGSGGFADVFRAVDRRTGDVVAVKVLKNVHSIQDEAVIRFRRELRLMEESLDHPHVAKIVAHGSFEDENEIWCAMPLAVNSLAAEIHVFRGDEAKVVDLARQLCAGVAHVHGQGVLHRDLKPGNILRSADGLWVVSDFGLAREDERKSLALTTTLAAGMGTYFYTSPEQWTRPKYADARDDVFSIGKILQHAITGEIPMVQADQIPESALRPVIQRATGPRDNRYATVADLLAAIEQAVASYSTAWEAPEDRLARLRPRVAGDVLDSVAADELLQWLLTEDADEFDQAARSLIAASREVVGYLWFANPTALRTALLRVADWVANGGFAWEYCDNIANSLRMTASVTADNHVLRATVSALLRMGTGHNRWHVRDVLVDVLQSIRDAERALVALEAIQAAGADDVEWSISDFAARSLHPTLREAVLNIRRAVATSGL